MYRHILNEHIIIDEDRNPEDIDVSGFTLKSSLCPDFWNDDEFDQHARKNLLIIAKDFLEGLELCDNIEDITITGSLANYNWDEENSDIDLHIIMDFSKISEDKDLVKKYFDAERKNWNQKHADITIYGYPVEIYLQDIDEPHKSSGVYSLLYGEWLKKPSSDNLSDNDTDFDNVQTLTSDLMNKIDDLEGRLEYDNDPETIYDEADQLFSEIKEIRKDGLESRNPEMSDGNLIFKSLRRSGYIEKLLDIKIKAYDQFNSL